jgi:H+/Cl- antiporter ClcA
VDDRASPLVVARTLGVCALLGVAVALVFVGFERAMHHAQHYLWVTLAGHDPSNLVVIGIATAGGLVLGLTLRFVPGRGGPHPAEHHNLFSGFDDTSVAAVLGGLLVGFVGLVAGASLGPEGAILPVVVGVSVLTIRLLRVHGPMASLVKAAGVGALLAAMFGNPVAGVIPLMELVPAAAIPMTMLMLPSLTAAATAVLTLQVLGVKPLGRIALEYGGFHTIHVLWAVLIGIAAGAVGLSVDRVMHVLRRLTIRLDARSIMLTATIGGLVLGILYAIGGPHVRFAGIPELGGLVADTEHVGPALFAVGIKILATAWCLAAGYRGGKIFPVAFAGGAIGLAIHLAVPSIPMPLAVGVGLSAAMATALGTPVTGALLAASLLTPNLVPLALLGVVAAHVVHLLAKYMEAQRSPAATG